VQGQGSGTAQPAGEDKVHAIPAAVCIAPAAWLAEHVRPAVSVSAQSIFILSSCWAQACRAKLDAPAHSLEAQAG
jgi:hypothetical protein